MHIRGSRLFKTVLYLLLLATVIPLHGARYRYFKIILKGSYRTGFLYVNGRYYGKVYRGRSRWLKLRSGYYYRMYVRYGRVRHNRRVYLPRSRNKTVLFRLPPNNSAGSGRITVKLRGRYSWVKLYLNGKYRGKLYRSRKRVLRVRPGRTWLVQARRSGLIRTRRVYVGRAKKLQKKALTLSF